MRSGDAFGRDLFDAGPDEGEGYTGPAEGARRVPGVAVTVDDATCLLRNGESTFVPAGTVHRFSLNSSIGLTCSVSLFPVRRDDLGGGPIKDPAG
jgi:hypothetical protein